MKFVLDTNVLSELDGRPRANAGVKKWASSVPQFDQYISSVSLLEIEIGARRLLRRDKERGGFLLSWIEDRVLPTFAGRILSFDAAVARQCAHLHVPVPRPERDAMIAATVLAHGMTLVTRNTKDFQNTSVPLINPFDI